LSLTLRDAQYLCWKTFKKLETKNKKQLTEAERVEDLTNKIGELAEKIQNLKNIKVVKDKENLGKQLSELLYAVFILAERHEVTLEEVFMQTIDDYILGFLS